MTHTRRIVRVPVTDTLIIDMMRTGWNAQFVDNRVGLPADAVFVGAYNDLAMGNTFFVFSHPSFSEVPDECIPPDFRPVFGRYHYDDVQELLERRIREDAFPMGLQVTPHA